MTIVLYNPETNILTICDEDVQHIDLSVTPFDAVANFIGHKKIMYVTEYVETDFSSVSEVLSNQDMQQEIVGDYNDSLTNRQYLHLTNKTKFYAQHDGAQYIFHGLYDCKPIDNLPSNLLTECKDIVEGLRIGLLEIIGDREVEQLMVAKNKEPVRKSRQNILNDLSMNSKGDGEKGSIDNPIEIDLNAAGNFKRNRT